METLYDFLKRWTGVAGLVGMSLFQLLNLQPSGQSRIAFVLFSLMAAFAIADWVAILLARKSVRRGTDFVHEPTYGRRARRAAAVGLVLTPPAYLWFALVYQIPNTWPVHIRAGAELREANPLIACLPGRSLMDLDEEVGTLFATDHEFVSSARLIHRIVIDNRSTVVSPPLDLRLELHTPRGRRLPPAQPFAAAVARPSVTPWRPIGFLAGRAPLTSLDRNTCGKPFLNYAGPCASTLDQDSWCFVNPPDDRRTWATPQIRLPSVPERTSVDVYLELALREGGAGQNIPATVQLRNSAEGKFSVQMRQDVDLNTKLGLR